MVRIPLYESRQGGCRPSIHLKLTPVWPGPQQDQNSQHAPPTPPAGISITMRLKPPQSRLGAGIPLLTLPLKMGPTPSARYDGKALSASDSKGCLPLSYNDENPETGPRVWSPDRDPVGDEIIIEFWAPARKSDRNTPLGPRVDLRKDPGGGLVGQGVGFIPSPPPPEDFKRERGPGEGTSGRNDPWEITVEWNLSKAPDGTKGAWSLGDANPSTAVDSPERAIGHGVFAVGPLRRFPDWDVDLSSASERLYAVYWMDPAPWDMTALSKRTSEIYQRIATYFNSPDPFRVFFRQIEYGQGGTGATYSFVLEYSAPSVPQTTPHDMVDLLAHETVHEYAMMEPETEEQAWYVEGVASYIGALIGLSRQDMIKSLNDYAQSYYTSPAVHLDYHYVLDHFWDNLHLTRVPYFRGLMYLAQVNGWIVEATNGKCSLDDIIMDLYHLRLEHKPCGTREFKTMLSKYIGEKATNDSFDSMIRGDLVVPRKDCFARYGLKLVRHDLEQFELGFDPNSMRTNKVSGLVKGSNAEKAGVREGDEIVLGYQVWGVADALENMMQLTVKRPGGEQTLEWWPRSNGEKVEAHLWVDVDDKGRDPADEL